ncbi:hypothetical protein DVR12_05815 [Chitinophaga silvatica]|uniref:SWIM-type domain-containing protein n=1 Tax=Chitinophaga silvatica TaxID=2282649 RepID=A0A3E1YE07_9BACT|nr:SWIM zinc finger family protein [Chitinophaga silvatica]RFS24714.1 hypothetical protein DVR12_05815 [Chitinophaga silvatica]
MLALRNFELQISDTIVYRGREYYESGAVVELEETGKDFWIAEVMGTELYTVEVSIFKKNNVKSYSCDCPYDGDICKHVVAVLFLLREKITNTDIRKKVVSKADFDKLVQKISLKEFQNFVLAYATKDKTFKSLFERHFADKESGGIDLGDKYAKQLKSLIRSHSNGDFIDYRSVHRLTNEVNRLLDEGQRQIYKSNFRDAFMVARSVLTEVIELITYCDDSSGRIGDVINGSIELIGIIAKTEGLPVDLQEEVFYFVQSAINNAIYFDYGDFGYEIFDLYQTLAIKLNRERSYLKSVDDQIKMASADKYPYRKEYFIAQKISFLRATGNVRGAQELVRENLDIVEVRRGEINCLIEDNDFPTAKKLIAGGIKIAEKKNHPGTVVEWQKELLRIAILENDIKEVRHYTKYFAFDHRFDTVYYNQWKNTFTIEEWEEEIERYIEERIADVELQYQKNKGKVWYSKDTLLLDLLAPIYIEEKYWNRLFALICKETDLDKLLQYHNYLIKIYPIQLLAIYIPAFEHKGKVVGNRREYANLAIKMKEVIRAIPEGKDEMIAVAKELILKYPRRPAMIEELNSVINEDC